MTDQQFEPETPVQRARKLKMIQEVAVAANRRRLLLESRNG